MADREPLSNLQPVFSCGLVMVLREMHYALTSRIYKNGAQQSASRAAFSGSEGSIPRFRAEFLGFTSKSVEVWPNLPRIERTCQVENLCVEPSARFSARIGANKAQKALQ